MTNEPVLYSVERREAIYSTASCVNQHCEIPKLAPKVKKWWPLEILKDIEGREVAQWKFWLVWNSGSGTHRHMNVCVQHHEAIKALWENDMALDVQEEEANERWAVRNGGRI